VVADQNVLPLLGLKLSAVWVGGLCKLDLIVVVGKASLIGNGFAISLFIAVPISDGVVLQMLV